MQTHHAVRRNEVNVAAIHRAEPTYIVFELCILNVEAR
jgi:hypothetical protein